ncbi:uncharacterized protein LOC110038081 [Phalaenopsis equestris]|uniref:uncharacterized protein LOC110038081 n=1 Tax=Phalaenopsis equestris TaxID=78828 RepID=UPI0009E42F1A|nr:uncharacterized protein LOC110038081 [Phalaenopsis equestris]
MSAHLDNGPDEVALLCIRTMPIRDIVRTCGDYKLIADSIKMAKLCSITLVIGLLICLRSAAKITHKAQALTSHAAKWHVCSTIDSFARDPETPCTIQIEEGDRNGVDDGDGEDEFYEEEAKSEDELEDTKLVHPQANTISFQKRQALGNSFIDFDNPILLTNQNGSQGLYACF